MKTCENEGTWWEHGWKRWFSCGAGRVTACAARVESDRVYFPEFRSPLPQKKWKKICLIIFLFLVELGILGVYGTAVYMLDQRPEVRNVGFVLVIGVVILDLMAWGPMSEWLMVRLRSGTCGI